MNEMNDIYDENRFCIYWYDEKLNIGFLFHLTVFCFIYSLNTYFLFVCCCVCFELLAMYILFT